MEITQNTWANFWNRRVELSNSADACAYHCMDHVMRKAKRDNFWHIKTLALRQKRERNDRQRCCVQDRMANTPSTHLVKEDIEIDMHTVPIGWVKQNVLSVTITKADNISNHGHDRCCASIVLPARIPTRKVNTGSYTITNAGFPSQKLRDVKANLILVHYFTCKGKNYHDMGSANVFMNHSPNTGGCLKRTRPVGYKPCSISDSKNTLESISPPISLSISCRRTKIFSDHEQKN